MIITEYGKVIRVHANEIRGEAGRSTQGVRLLRLGRRGQNRRGRIDPGRP